ncbi:MAG: MerR family transcriptional regulator [Paludibacteraceae bacterium]|nr:MerR family transcriptional regulator [Paludibacteraceae bacterium]
MLKEGKLYYTIGEVAEMLDISTSNIRYWESEFPHIKPKINQSGKRAYTDKNIQAVRMIQYLLRDKRMTIEGAKLYLKDKRHIYLEQADNINIVDELLKIKTELGEIRRELNIFDKDKIK